MIKIIIIKKLILDSGFIIASSNTGVYFWTRTRNLEESNSFGLEIGLGDMK